MAIKNYLITTSILEYFNEIQHTTATDFTNILYMLDRGYSMIWCKLKQVTNTVDSENSQWINMLKSFWVINSTMVELNHAMADWVRTLQRILQIASHFVWLNQNTVLAHPISKQVTNNFIRKSHITIYIPTHQCGTQTQSKYLKLLCEQSFEVHSIKITTSFKIINQQLTNYHVYYEILIAKHHPS